MYKFVHDFFRDENIVMPIMDAYSDFKFVEYIFSLDFKIAYKLLKKCIKKINDNILEKERRKCWDLYLREYEIENGFRGTFNEYCDSMIKPQSNVTSDDPKTNEIEEERILNKYKGDKPLSVERVIV
jgi:hypothetical protein